MRRKLVAAIIAAILGSGTAMAERAQAPIYYRSTDRSVETRALQPLKSELVSEPLLNDGLSLEPQYRQPEYLAPQFEETRSGPRDLLAGGSFEEAPFSRYGGTGDFETDTTELYEPVKTVGYKPVEPVLYGGAPEAPVWRATSNEFEIQVGSYREFSNANAAMSKYTAVAPTRIGHADVGGANFYRVFVAGGTTRQAAEQQLATLSRMGVNGFIVSNK